MPRPLGVDDWSRHGAALAAETSGRQLFSGGSSLPEAGLPLARRAPLQPNAPAPSQPACQIQVRQFAMWGARGRPYWSRAGATPPDECEERSSRTQCRSPRRPGAASGTRQWRAGCARRSRTSLRPHGTHARRKLPCSVIGQHDREVRASHAVAGLLDQPGGCAGLAPREQAATSEQLSRGYRTTVWVLSRQHASTLHRFSTDAATPQFQRVDGSPGRDRGPDAGERFSVGEIVSVHIASYRRACLDKAGRGLEPRQPLSSQERSADERVRREQVGRPRFASG